LEDRKGTDMTANMYQKLAMRTNDGKCNDRLRNATTTVTIDVGGVINASLGLSGETGELNDMIKKAVFHGHAMEEEKVKKEIGDILWYVAMMCESFHFEMNEIMQMNIDKLKARYPEGFDPERSQHRKEGDV
jgi:NTP pyrophosphatase (non-canonical NTP hydrolase)